MSHFNQKKYHMVDKKNKKKRKNKKHRIHRKFEPKYFIHMHSML